MTPLGLLRTLIKGISENTTPNELAAGAAMGVLIGLVPKANLTAQLLLVLIMVFRVNVPLAAVVGLLVSLVSPLVDPITNAIGYKLLAQTPALTPLWTKLYNMPVMPWTAFNNTIVLGGLILGLILFAPSFFLARKLARVYDEKYKDRFTGSKFVKAVKASWLCDWYFKMGAN